MILKRFKKIIAGTLSITLIIACMMFTGCGRSELNLIGWVHAGTPVFDAVLSVYDTNGNQIMKTSNLFADDQGAILIGSKEKLPSDFRIVTDGGTLNGNEFIEKLSADVRSYNAEEDTLYINPATTLVSAYLDKNSMSSLAEASLAVKNFLEIPEYIDIPSGTQLSNEYFNNDQFLAEAGENGGINPFIDKLLTEMEAGETHPFNEPSLLQGGAAAWLATTLAEGAVSYVGGELMGWGLDQAGISLSPEDHTAEELEKIQEGMTEMKAELANMSIQLDAISSKLDNIKKQLEDMLKQISHKQDLSDYGNRVSLLNDLISSIYTIRRDLNKFVINTPANPEPMRNSLINRIESNIIDYADVFHNQLVGLAGEKPLLTLWREIVYEDRYLDSDDYNKVKAQYDLFRQYQDAILLLQVEYYHATEGLPGENAEIIMDCIERYESHLKQQEALLVLPIEKNTVIDTKWDGMYYSENIELGKFGSSFKLGGKTKNQVTAYMDELARSNYAGFDDWEALDYDSFGALIENHIINRSTNNWSEFMVNQGWPGVKLDYGTMVPFFELNDHTKFVYYLNDGPHFKLISDYPEAGFTNTGKGFYMIMVYRPVTMSEYGYAHLRK